MKTRTYFDTENRKFSIKEVIRWCDIPLWMYVEDEHGQVYLCCISEDRSNVLHNDFKNPTYILTPINPTIYMALYEGKLTVDMPFLQATFGYRIVATDAHEKDLIFPCNPSDPQYHHLPEPISILTNRALPY